MRDLAEIDKNLATVCSARDKAVDNRQSALRTAENAERVALTCELHIASYDERITALLDERLGTRCPKPHSSGSASAGSVTAG